MLIEELDEPVYYDDFINTFCHSGSVIIQCKCGRIHVAEDELCLLEEEEIEELLEDEKKNPGMVIRSNCTSISWTWINGEQVVFECPCGYDKDLCNFIENHYPEILKLITKIVKVETEDVKRKEKLLKEATG